MRKAGTHVPATGNACIVFGAVNGQKLSQAGLFSHPDGPQAEQLAARAGLMTLKVSNSVIPGLRDRLNEGDIGARGQLWLHPIRPELLTELRARYATQASKPTKATANRSQGSPSKLANGDSFAPASAKPPSGSPDFSQLVAAYRLIDAAGVWLEKLKVELDETLAQIAKSSAFSFLSETETTDTDHYSGGDGWILDGWRWTYPTRHRRVRIGQLSVVADIGRPGRPAAVLGVPCVLVMWSSAAHDWAGSIDTANDFWPPHDATTALLGGHCFQWTGKTPGNGPAAIGSLKDGAWFYVVPLTALTNFAQLRKLVVQPALALLNGTPIDTAFTAAAGVLRFRQDGKEFVLDQ